MKLLIPVICFIFSLSPVFGQALKRLQPGKLYDQGEQIYAPLYGFIGEVPEGWSGLLPRDTEVFLFTSQTVTQGQILVFAREKGNLEEIKKNWAKGVSLNEGMTIKAQNKTITEEGILSGDLSVVGNYGPDNKGYAVAKCSPYGPCITVLAVAPSQYIETVKGVVDDFISKSTFEEPKDISPYADFDWDAFLKMKIIVNYASMDNSSKSTRIILCDDGTFYAEFRKKGLMKNINPQYRGKNTGTWKAQGIGETGTLTLIFKKKFPDLKVALRIKDEKLFANNERFYTIHSTKCR